MQVWGDNTSSSSSSSLAAAASPSPAMIKDQGGDNSSTKKANSNKGTSQQQDGEDFGFGGGIEGLVALYLNYPPRALARRVIELQSDLRRAARREVTHN